MNNGTQKMNNGLPNWELFAKQSEFFWRFQQTVALVEIGIFSGWYTLFKDKEWFLAISIILFGSFILVVLFLVIKRASQYLNALREPALKELPADLGMPIFKIPSHKIGIAIPVTLIIFNTLLLVFSIVKYSEVY